MCHYPSARMVEGNCDVMDAIGGYFELADYEEGIFPHKDGILLNTGRNALEFILRSIGNVKKVYLPYYTCDVVLEPLKKLNIPWSFYHINSQLEIADQLNPGEGEYVIANNYFGIKDAYIQTLADFLGEHLIVDCAQAFFAKPIHGINTFYSPRKYVGVADGGVAYLGQSGQSFVEVNEVDCTKNHDSHLFKRKLLGAEAGFEDYQVNERRLNNQQIRWMSDTTKEILDHIDYSRVVARRRENYTILHDSLADNNLFTSPFFDSFVCPMVYPFVARDCEYIRTKMIKKQIYVAKYWPSIFPNNSFKLEFFLVNGVIPLPIDQRYGEPEMKTIIQTILAGERS